MSNDLPSPSPTKGWTLKRVLLFPFRLALALGYVLTITATRSAIIVSWVYLLLYFGLSSSALRDTVSDAISASIPGTVRVGAFQWGPWPGSLQLAQIEVLAPEGASVLTVDAVEVELNLTEMFLSASQRAVGVSGPWVVSLERFQIAGSEVLLAEGANGGIGLFDALRDPEAPSSDEGLPKGLEVSVAEWSLIDTNVQLKLPALSGSVDGLHWVGSAALHAEGTLEYALKEARIAGLTTFHRAFKAEDGASKALRVRNVVFEGLRGTHQRAELASLGALLSDGTLGLRGALDFGGDELAWEAVVDLAMGAKSDVLPMLSQGMSDGAFSLKVTGEGKGKTLAVDLDLRSPELWAGGFPLEEMSLKASLSRVEEVDLRVEHFEARALGGHLQLDEGSLRTQSGDDVVFMAPLRLTDVDPLAVLGSTWVNIQPGTFPYAEGWLGGAVKVSGRWNALTKRLEADAQTEALTMRWDGDPTIPLHSTYALGGLFHFDSQEQDSGVAIRKLAFKEASLTSGADKLLFEGNVSPDSGELDVDLDVHLHNMSRLFKPLLPLPVGGVLHLKKLHVAGSFLNPAVSGDLHWGRAKVDGRALGTVSAAFSLSDGEVRVSKLRTSSDMGSLELSASLQLFDKTVGTLSKSLPFRISKLLLRHVALEKIWPAAALKTDVDFELTREVRGRLSALLPSLQGGGLLTVNALSSSKHRVRKFKANVSATPTKLRLEKAKLTLCRQSLKGGCLAGGPSLEGAVDYQKRGGRFSSTLRLKDFPLEAVRQFVPGFGFRGNVWATLRAEGSPKEPRVMGTLRVGALKTGGLHLGDATFELSWGERPGDIIVNSSDFFNHMVLEESELRFSDLGIQNLALRVKTSRLPLSQLFPALRGPAFSLKHTGNVEFTYQPGRAEDWQLHAYADPGAVRIALHGNAVRYKNDDVLALRLGKSGITLDPVHLVSDRGSKSSGLQLCGNMSFPGALNLEVTGRIDMDLVRPTRAIRDAFSRIEGAFDVGLPRHASGPNMCLPLSARNVLRIGGTQKKPSFDGRLAANKIRLLPRGLPQQLSLTDGAIAQLVPGSSAGIQHIRFEEADNFSGQFDDGTFQVVGDIELRDFGLHALQLHVVGTDIAYASSGEFNATFNPDLRLSARDFGDERKRALALRGEVEVTDGTYYKSFDQLAKVLGAVTGDQFEQFSQPVTERIPWLKALVMDLQVRSTSHNLNLNSSFPLGTTDLDARLDLKIQGTLDRPQVFNRVDLAPGGTVTYDILNREFEVLHGYLDFNGEAGRPRIDIRAQTEIEYLESTGAESDEVEEKSVILTISISGTLPDALEIELSGSPGGFDEGDLQSLLLTGKPLSTGTLAREDYQFNVPVGTYLKELLASPFVESVNVGLDSQGDWASEILTRLGRYASLQARAEGESGASTRLSARFQLHLSDSIVLEGNVDRATGATTTTDAQGETYEARIKYRYVLD